MRGFLRAASVFALIASSSTAFAYTPQWLECSGDLTVTASNGAQSKRPATEIYVVDSDTKNLFKYSETSKRLSFMGAQRANNVLKWSSSVGGLELHSWDGQLDLGSMMLQQTAKGGGETETWSQHCTPTAPRPEG